MTFIVCYSGNKTEVLQSLTAIGATFEDVGFNNLVVNFGGRIEDLRAIKGVTAATEEEEKRPF